MPHYCVNVCRNCAVVKRDPTDLILALNIILKWGREKLHLLAALGYQYWSRLIALCLRAAGSSFFVLGYHLVII